MQVRSSRLGARGSGEEQSRGRMALARAGCLWALVASWLGAFGCDDGGSAATDATDADVLDVEIAEATDGGDLGAEDAGDAIPDVADDAIFDEASEEVEDGAEEWDVDSDGDAAYFCPDGPRDLVIDVSVDQLYDAIAAATPLAVVDVREPSETASGIIAGAWLMPWNSGVLRSDHATLPADRPLYVICGSWMRSAPAAAFLAENGHECVRNVLGGMSAWRSAGYPVVPP